MEVKVKLLNSDARLPTKTNDPDAGWDLYSIENIEIPTHERRTVKTGIAMDIPDGHVGLIYDRSGVASKNGLMRSGGVIDSGYHGEIGVILYNSSADNYTIAVGDRIAQLIIHTIPDTRLIESKEFTKTTIRNRDGFGSSGV